MELCNLIIEHHEDIVRGEKDNEGGEFFEIVYWYCFMKGNS